MNPKTLRMAIARLKARRAKDGILGTSSLRDLLDELKRTAFKDAKP